MERWWNAPAEGEGDPLFLIVETKLHDPSAWKKRALEKTSVLVSDATAQILDRVHQSLTIVYDEEDPKKLAAAHLVFTVNTERAERIQRLLAQEKVDEKTGEKYPFSNAYRFISCMAADEPDAFNVVAVLAQGSWKMKPDRKGEMKRTFSVSPISVTTGFQQLLAGYFAQSILRHLPKALQAGVCQEVAQQVMSYIGQIASAKVKGDVNFPTVEDRDPARRRQAYDAAIDALCKDLRPLAYAKARDLYPGEYAADDARGDRWIVNDERWFALTRSPDPHPIPMFFTDGGKVKLLIGEMRFHAGISKKNRHRGRLTPNDRVLADRPERVQNKGATGLQAWYAAIPILDADNVTEAKPQQETDGGRQLDLGLHLAPLQGGGKWKLTGREILVPLEGNRDRMERILRRKDLEIAWSRLVRKDDEWFLQFTLRVKTPVSVPTDRVLGVAFGIDAVATWHLADCEGQTLATGALAPNEQILAFLREKRGLEWDQQKGRWIGGEGFAGQLESIAHGVANALVELAAEHHARLALEDVSYVQKASRDHAANVLFTAWNYGQLRRFVGYKAPLAGEEEPLYASDYVTNLTCPSCNAIRSKGQKPEHATTWRENGTLHCRACGFTGAITPAERARRAALHALSLIR